MKEQEIIEQMVRQMVANLIDFYPIHYEPLDPEWEELIVGGDE